MLIDEATILVRSGNGGSGRRSFFAAKGGPSGGNGGFGGAVYAVLARDMKDLRYYAANPHLHAENGQGGGTNRKHGKNGDDLLLLVPPNTSITDLDTGREFVIDSVNPRALISRGGKGGKGNDALKTATNQTPMKAEPGTPGIQKRLRLVMKLIAQYGLIGLPNAGKSSLINMLTALEARVADYPFTTLTPNLGVFQGKVIADIPGLIEGASQGKGLGTRFLKHIEKVDLLLHCVSSESKDVRADYDVVTKELEQYSRLLAEKKRVILLTKIDLTSEETVKVQIAELEKTGNRVIPVSIYSEDALRSLKESIA